jgi:hypothetical protein
MRQPYEQNIDQNYNPELTYEECLRIVKGLEAVKSYHLGNSRIVERAARLMQLKKIHYLPSLNLLIEVMAAKALEDIKQSSVKCNPSNNSDFLSHAPGSSIL